MATILLAHGAWNGGWAWAKMRPLFANAGHVFWTPTMTGLGERQHLAGPDIDLETHIGDILGVIEAEELTEVTMLAHSYGGMVATSVADRARDRITRLIYVDAIVPRDGQSVTDLMPGLPLPSGTPDDWQVPPNPLSPDLSREDEAWILRHRCPHPVGCFTQRINLADEPACPRHYIYALQCGPVDRFAAFRDRAGKEDGWALHTIDATHSPNITAPWALFGIIQDILTGT